MNGHRAEWLQAICQGLKHTPLVLQHATHGVVDGVLPLVLVRSLLFGKFLSSLPYLNTGGVWAATPEIASALVSKACELADKHQVRYLELRHEVELAHWQFNASRTDKMHMRLPLPQTDEELDKSLKSKLRSQIRKSNEYGLSIEWGHDNLLKPFYQVFAVNMRDLGTPVFSRRLFSEILSAFGEQAELCIVRKDHLPIASALLVHAGGVSEVPSASSLRQFNFTNANMWMYRNLLTRAIERGSQIFDFGRSSVDSGTYKFKAQWGAQPHPAIWQYYVRQGSAEDMRPESAGKKKLVSIWQKLPVRLTRLIGPSIVRGIP
ncbi:MAG: FemAB family PEP-CTERM system-associated protein [Pirellulaceae bacterium]